LGKTPTTSVRRLKLSCQERGRWGVAEHGSVDDVGQVAFEDSHGLALGMAVVEGAVVELAGAGFTAQLDHRGAMEDGIEAAVAAAVETVSDRSSAGFPGAGWDGCGAVEPGEAGFGEAANVAGLEEYLGGGADGDAGNSGEL